MQTPHFSCFNPHILHTISSTPPKYTITSEVIGFKIASHPGEPITFHIKWLATPGSKPFIKYEWVAPRGRKVFTHDEWLAPRGRKAFIYDEWLAARGSGALCIYFGALPGAASQTHWQNPSATGTTPKSSKKILSSTTELLNFYYF